MSIDMLMVFLRNVGSGTEGSMSTTVPMAGAPHVQFAGESVGPSTVSKKVSSVAYSLHHVQCCMYM